MGGKSLFGSTEKISVFSVIIDDLAESRTSHFKNVVRRVTTVFNLIDGQQQR
jgi:hypothetical protein